jgi:hypothetical protein
MLIIKIVLQLACAHLVVISEQFMCITLESIHCIKEQFRANKIMLITLVKILTDLLKRLNLPKSNMYTMKIEDIIPRVEW